MNKLPKLFLFAGVVAAVALVVLVMSRPRAAQSPGELQVSASEAAPEAPAEIGHSSFYHKNVPQPASDSNRVQVPAAGSPATTNTSLAWENRLDELLSSSQPEADKAKQMLELFAQLPTDGQREVAQHLSNLLPDGEYGLMHPYLTDATLPEEVSDILLDDVLNRPNSVKLPALLDVARTAQHPKAAEAKDFLELLLDEDYGENWDAWQTKTKQWLAENPD